MKIIKFTLYIFILITFLFLSFSIYEVATFSSKYVNKPYISFSVKNIRNPKVKQFVKFIDNRYSYIYKNLFSNNNNLLEVLDRDTLPNEVFYKGKKNNFTINKNKLNNNSDSWKRSHGNFSSNRFSDLKQINSENLNDLKLEWVYEFQEKPIIDIQANPVMAERKLFLPTVKKSLITLDAVTGKKIWEYKTKKHSVARRGLIYNKNENDDNSYIYFCANRQLVSLNTKNGKPNKSFGNNGIVKLPQICKVAPLIIDQNLVITTFEPAVEIYDLITGKVKWKFFLKKNYNEKRVNGKRFDYSGGNPWGGIAADYDRKIVFISTGNAGNYFNGINRPGDNKYSNSIVALDLVKKKKIWDFQEVRHDIWDLDIPASPIVTTINHENKIIDVVVAVTKLGNTIILDRLTGEPIFDYKEKKVETSKIEGEITSNYQFIFDKPKPFSKQFFNINEFSDTYKKSDEYKNEENFIYGFFKPVEENKRLVMYNLHGGAEWMGASVNHRNGMLYINSNNIPWELHILKETKEFSYNNYVSRFYRLKDQNGFPASKTPWGTITAINLNIGQILWQKPFGMHPNYISNKVEDSGTENFGGLTATAGNIILATGTLDNEFRIYNSKNGEELWSYKMEYSGSNPPITYSINNEQYIVVVSTGSYNLNRGYPKINKLGNLIYCFRLKKN